MAGRPGRRHAGGPAAAAVSTADDAPLVSVVVPMHNEIGFIGPCLDGFERQSWPLDRLEVLVVDGSSDDGSRGYVETFGATRPWVRVVDNPDRKASAAFNRGIAASTGVVVCLFSSHGVPDPHFVEQSVAALRATGAAGVGGRLDHDGTDPSSAAIGQAMMSPFGMASPFRYATGVSEVDTIGHPAYRREVLEAVGPFDESLARNSDYEFNWRIRAAGERLVFDPAITSVYRPRPGLRALASQFWWYGRWKAEVIRRHPRSVRPRHLVAPAFTLGLVAVPVALTRPHGRRIVALTGGLYVGLAVAAALDAERRSAHPVDLVTLVAAFPVMHVAWGAGLLTSLVRRPTTG